MKLIDLCVLIINGWVTNKKSKYKKDENKGIYFVVEFIFNQLENIKATLELSKQSKKKINISEKTDLKYYLCVPIQLLALATIVSQYKDLNNVYEDLNELHKEMNKHIIYRNYGDFVDTKLVKVFSGMATEAISSCWQSNLKDHNDIVRILSHQNLISQRLEEILSTLSLIQDLCISCRSPLQRANAIITLYNYAIKDKDIIVINICKRLADYLASSYNYNEYQQQYINHAMQLLQNYWTLKNGISESTIAMSNMKR